MRSHAPSIPFVLILLGALLVTIGCDDSDDNDEMLFAALVSDDDSGASSPSFGSGGVVTSSPTSGDDFANAVASDGSSLYVVGVDSNGGDQWRIEKRSLSTGTLDAGFGSGGGVTSNPSGNSDVAKGIAIDGTNLYVVGHDVTAGGGNAQWRIEKRDLNTGGLDAGFGTGGVATSNPSSSNDTVNAVLNVGTSLYVIGIDRNSGSAQWRIEKRSISTGSLDAGFGTGGVVTSNPGSGEDFANAAASDGSSLYVVGVDSNGGDQWRIEKRSLSTGALDAGFGSGGVVTSNPSGNSDVAKGIAIDGTNLYVVGHDDSSGGGNAQWRVEKRSASTGALETSFGTGGVVTSNPGSGNDSANAVLSNGTSLYVVGVDMNSGNAQWRIEKRNLGTGALESGFGSGGVVTSNPSSQDDTANAVTSDSTDLYIVGNDRSLGVSDSRWRIEKRGK